MKVIELSDTSLELDDPRGFFGGERLPSLTSLVLGHHRLGDDAARALTECCAQGSIRRLVLTASVGWSDTSWSELYRALAPSIFELVVGRDSATEAGALAGFASGRYPVLTTWDMSESDIDAQVAGELLTPGRFPALAVLRASGTPELVDVLSRSSLIGQLRELQVISEPGCIRAIHDSPHLGRFTLVDD